MANARSCMIFEARRLSRRWISVTDRANRVRNVASSRAESPPPTTAMSWSRKKKPSQVAHHETPWPDSSFSPVEAELAVLGPHRQDDGLGVVHGAGGVGDGLDVAGEVDLDDVVGDQLGAEPLGLPAELSIRSGPMTPSGKPGKFSTSVVFISAPPAVTEPSKTRGRRLARAV